jgi:hypothetical protein
VTLKTERASITINSIESIGAQVIRSIDGHYLYGKRIPKSDYPKDSPYYYNLAVNDDGDFLIFNYPVEGTRPVFQTYARDGQIKLEVVLDPGDFELLLTPAAAGIVFFRGDLYALAEEKSAAEIRLRFLKFLLKLKIQTDE